MLFMYDSIKLFSSATVSIVIIRSNVIQHQISIFKCFLKDHVTLKTGVMKMPKIQLCQHMNELHFKGVLLCFFTFCILVRV